MDKKALAKILKDCISRSQEQDEWDDDIQPSMRMKVDGEMLKLQLETVISVLES